MKAYSQRLWLGYAGCLQPFRGNESGHWVEERFRELAILAQGVAYSLQIRVLPLVLFASIVFALSCTSTAFVPPEEVRAERLNKTILCPICPGESIDQAGNDLAIQMRAIVREQISDGWDDDRIKQFWIDKYGPSVILEPPKEGIGLIAWLLPPVALVVSVVLLWMALKWMRKPLLEDADEHGTQPQLTQRELSYYRNKIFDALDLEDDAHISSEDSETSANAKGAS